MVSGSELCLAELFQWNIETKVTLSIVKGFTLGILNQNCGASRDSIDASGEHAMVVTESDLVTYPNVELEQGSFTLRDQVMPIIGMPKITVCNRLKTRFTAIAIVPDQHFDKMDEFMFRHALHCFQSVIAKPAGNFDRSAGLFKRLEQKA